MPQAATQEGEASGSGPTRALPRSQRSTAAARPTATTRSMALVRARQSPGSQSPLEPTVRSNTRKRKRDPAANRKSKKRKRTGEEEEVSSADSSPVRQPHIPDRMYRLHDLNTSKAIQKAREDVSAKRARHMGLATLNVHMCRASMCVLDDPNLVPDRESARTAVLNAGRSVLGLSSSVGGKPLARCCGFWVDWDEKNKIGTALTTSRLICTKSASLDSWSGQEEYDTNAEVLVHMQGGTTEKATLQYHQKHYDLAFFSVRMDRPVHILSFNDGVKRSDHVFELGRDESSFLRISHGVVKFLNPNLLERYHYMHVHSADPRPKYGKGAPLIDFGGKIVGMVNGNTSGSFIPSSILVKCLHLWRKFQRIPRPQLGMKFWSIKFVDIALAENILCKCNIDDGLIVKRVSYGSPAEKLGILVGDVISCFNGEHISTTVELENMMLSKCEDENNSLNSELNVKLDVFHIRKSRWSDRTLTVKVSDDSEVVATGVTYPFVEGTP
ncbi:hypothetical protein CFC21_103350 [Triticum aestivum]|uniref:PDZ domain-containing protein n=4 Tax=Triticum TaxID=4564 RepID=A0A9R1A2W7_TRITD|nr:probable periplasmic serine protease do/HhoA-like isoform X1 [Triticum aestivum]KAF7102167.1 hypothetical protein CFC21_103350 [Triticum aestivum]VAI88579.1 unnamed protein product [Triticum turgidum subsp. durum]